MFIYLFQTTGSDRAHLGVAGQDAAAAVRDGEPRDGGAAAVPGVHAGRRHDRQSRRYDTPLHTVVIYSFTS